MELVLTPIRASRKLLAVLAANDTTDFEELLRPNAYLQIWSENGRETYVTSADVSQALHQLAEDWSEPMVNIESWDETEDSVTVSFQIWAKEYGLLAQHEHVLTVTLRDEQIEMIMLYRNPVYELVM